MALRRVAGTVTRRMLGGSSSFSGDLALARGSGGAGGSREWDRASVSRFWSFGGSKGGDDEDDGEDASRADHADADASVEERERVRRGQIRRRARASGRDASGADDASPWTRAMEDATRASSSAGDDASAAPPSPEVTSPRWNVPDDPADPFAVAAAPPSGSGGDAPARAPRSRSPISSRRRCPRIRGRSAAPGRARRPRTPTPRSRLHSPGRQPLRQEPSQGVQRREARRDFSLARDVQSAKFVRQRGTRAHRPRPILQPRGRRPRDGGASGTHTRERRRGVSNRRHVRVVGHVQIRARREARRAEEPRGNAKRRRAPSGVDCGRNETRRGRRNRRSAPDATPGRAIAWRFTCGTVRWDWRGDQLERIFAPFGTVSRARLFWPNGAKPSAVLTLDSKRAAEMAVATLDGVSLPGCRAPMEIGLHVPKANKKKKRGEESESESESASDAESSRIRNRRTPRLPRRRSTRRPWRSRRTCWRWPRRRARQLARFPTRVRRAERRRRRRLWLAPRLSTPTPPRNTPRNSRRRNRRGVPRPNHRTSPRASHRTSRARVARRRAWLAARDAVTSNTLANETL